MAVLWAMAALSIAVSGMVYAVRGEIRNVSWQKELAVATMLADAGATLVARELAISGIRDGLLRDHELTFEGHRVQVKSVPLGGLIDLNFATESLLTTLFTVAGGLDRPQAEQFAQRIIDWRDPDEDPMPSGAEDAAYAAAGSRFRTRGNRFESPEDLLQVLGSDFDLYQKVSRLVTVEAEGQTGVNPAAAPPEVLLVLAGGDAQVAGSYESARARDGVLADTTRFPVEYRHSGSGSRFLIEARIGLSNGATLVRRRFTDFSRVAGSNLWITMRVERFVQVRENG